MIELLPTPKKCEVIDEKRHALARTVCTKVAEWQPALDAFCESFAKIFECEMQKGVCGGVELVRDETLAKNAYKLESEGALRIFASDAEGLNYGLATALQLLRVSGGEATVPAVRIEDRPDKDFRAFMIDVGFCWQPFDKMLKYIDLCHFYKINHLHMHISDAAGYSLPSKAFPKLPNKGKHYTFEQVAELNRYAAARGVKLVPEFECPGHATALNRAYPEVFSNHADGEGADFNLHGRTEVFGRKKRPYAAVHLEYGNVRKRNRLHAVELAFAEMMLVNNSVIDKAIVMIVIRRKPKHECLSAAEAFGKRFVIHQVAHAVV